MLLFAGEPAAVAGLRRPVALAWLDAGRTLAVANRDGGVCLIDVQQRHTVREFPIGGRLSAAASLPGESWLLVTDEQRHELVWLALQGDALEELARLRVSPFPVGVAVSANGPRCFVTSLWSRRVEEIELRPPRGADKSFQMRRSRSVRLPFPPRCLAPGPSGDRVLVADAFGGRLAVVNFAEGKVESQRSLAGHNLRSLALARGGRGVWISHQTLSSTARTSRDDIASGELMQNTLRRIQWRDTSQPVSDWDEQADVISLGEAGGGAADPSGVAVLDANTLLVALSGVDEVAIVSAQRGIVKRLPVERRPTAVLLAPDGRRAYVANTLSNSVSVIDVEQPRAPSVIRLGPIPALGPGERGERLFYNARLSLDGWLSCHSCHPDGHTNGRLADTTADGSFGAPKRVLSLLGVGITDPWAWNGSFKHLHDQVHNSVRSSMQGPAISDAEAGDVVAFLHTLRPAPPISIGDDENVNGPPSSERSTKQASVTRGRAVFQRRGCGQCHIPPLTYTSHDVYDVGLRDAVGNTKFNPPSLRGVSQLPRLFHDNRAASLEEVFAVHGHQVTEELSPGDLADLVEFLRSL